jgi:hypothetical protein
MGGVIARQLVLNIAAPSFGSDVAADCSDRRENRDPRRRRKAIIDKEDAIREQKAIIDEGGAIRERRPLSKGYFAALPLICIG